MKMQSVNSRFSYLLYHVGQYSVLLCLETEIEKQKIGRGVYLISQITNDMLWCPF